MAHAAKRMSSVKRDQIIWGCFVQWPELSLTLGCFLLLLLPLIFTRLFWLCVCVRRRSAGHPARVSQGQVRAGRPQLRGLQRGGPVCVQGRRLLVPLRRRVPAVQLPRGGAPSHGGQLGQNQGLLERSQPGLWGVRSVVSFPPVWPLKPPSVGESGPVVTRDDGQRRRRSNRVDSVWSQCFWRQKIRRHFWGFWTQNKDFGNCQGTCWTWDIIIFIIIIRIRRRRNRRRIKLTNNVITYRLTYCLLFLIPFLNATD